MLDVEVVSPLVCADALEGIAAGSPFVYFVAVSCFSFGLLISLSKAVDGGIYEGRIMTMLIILLVLHVDCCLHMLHMCLR